MFIFVEKRIVSAEFRAIPPELYGNCVFPQNFHTRNLGQITEFHAVVTATQETNFKFPPFQIFQISKFFTSGQAFNFIDFHLVSPSESQSRWIDELRMNCFWRMADPLKVLSLLFSRKHYCRFTELSLYWLKLCSGATHYTAAPYSSGQNLKGILSNASIERFTKVLFKKRVMQNHKFH